jgi:hypothetical protein
MGVTADIKTLLRLFWAPPAKAGGAQRLLELTTRFGDYGAVE